MTDLYQPRYQWKRTQLDERDPPTDLLLHTHEDVQCALLA
jgi:hypothetical protein